MYFDYLMPFLTYTMDGDDLLVGDIFSGFFNAVTGETGIFDGKHVSDGKGGTLDVSGVMRIRNFDFEATYWGYETYDLGREKGESGMPAGIMNMVFKKGNPLIGFLQLIAALPPIAGSGVFALQAQLLAQLLASFDSALVMLSALDRAAKATGWADGRDPLLIDLDGDGIETSDLADGVYFDVDGDLFAERTGWLKGDDGFLVRDLNDNGRIDDVSEMFGGRFGGGFAVNDNLIDEVTYGRKIEA